MTESFAFISTTTLSVNTNLNNKPGTMIRRAEGGSEMPFALPERS